MRDKSSTCLLHTINTQWKLTSTFFHLDMLWHNKRQQRCNPLGVQFLTRSTIKIFDPINSLFWRLSFYYTQIFSKIPSIPDTTGTLPAPLGRSKMPPDLGKHSGRVGRGRIAPREESLLQCNEWLQWLIATTTTNDI